MGWLASMDNPMDVVEIDETFEHTMCDPTNDVYWNRTGALVDIVKGPFVHELHADADVWI